ncbi:MAG: glycosyltransferase family 87 protein, partial [Candidatus Auribacterota bacterium]|nr:glycosyltransferase family 87 protein [Candidatus Auribacterota bacterium]
MNQHTENEAAGGINNRALFLTALLLIAFSVAFFLYYSLDTINNSVFGIDFSPYHVAGQLAAARDWGPLTDYTATGGFEADSGPFLDAFHQYFFPRSPVGTRWIYLPSYVWIFRPLAGLGFPAAARVWLLVNAVLALLCVWMLCRARPFTGDRNITLLRTAWFIFIGLTFQPVFDDLWHGNVSVLIFAGFCLSYLLLKGGHNFSAGLALGLIVPLKFYPAIFVPYFIWRRNWKLVAGVAVSCLAICLISLLTVGWEGNLAYFQMVRGELGTGGIAAFNDQSISGFLLHVFDYGDVNVWRNTPTPLWFAILRLTLVAALFAAVIRVMRRKPEKPADHSAAQDLDLSLVIFVMLLASPITWYHYYTWLLLPIFCLFDSLLLSRETKLSDYLILAIGYGLVVVQGIDVIRPFAAAAIDRIWILRFLLS